MRPRTITVDVARGGDYALADYRRQADESTLLWWMEQVGSAIYYFGADHPALCWASPASEVAPRPVGVVMAVSSDGRFVEVLMNGEARYA